MDKAPSPGILPETAGHIVAREQRVAEAGKFNLLSNVFMRVVLRDQHACQYVLRVLTGIPDLIVREVRTEYRVSKTTSHDAVLPDLFIIYISETDLWSAGYTTYLIEKHFKGTNILYNDGQHIMYVNAEAIRKCVKSAKRCLWRDRNKVARKENWKRPEPWPFGLRV